MGEERQDAANTPPGRKLSVSEAADALGISAEAVRSRLKRGTLRSVKEGSTVYVLLPTDQTRPGTDQIPPQIDQTTARSQSDNDALISEMRSHIEDLQAQLQAERQAHSEARTLLLRALERIPPALEPPGASQSAAEASEGTEEPRPATGGAHGAAERPFTEEEAPRRPWWRFWGQE